MNKDVAFDAMFFCSVMVIVVGFGSLVYIGGVQDHDMKIECIRAGKSVVGGSCVEAEQ